MSLTQRRTPINKAGRRKLEWDRARARVWPSVLERHDHCCALCGVNQRDALLDPHHLMGRNLGAWSHCAELLVPLCRSNAYTRKEGCHNRWHDGHLSSAERERLLQGALERLDVRLNPEMTPLVSIWPHDAATHIRGILAELEALGITPDPSRELDRKDPRQTLLDARGA